jgi:hypothetical protein
MAQLGSRQYPDNYIAAINNRSFYGLSADAGIAIIAPAAGGGHPTLINWASSGVNVYLRTLRLGYKSGNNAPGNIIWAKTENVGDAAATGSPIATATIVAKKPCLVGSGSTGSSKVQWSPTTNTFTATPTADAATGLSLFTGVAATAVAPFELEIEDIGIVLAPGNAISLCYSTTTTTSLLNIYLSWDEISTSA